MVYNVNYLKAVDVLIYFIQSVDKKRLKAKFIF